ncbi:MAG: type I methionyl aminopeptidase [Oligoflexia bacterium]|nr:type I methionyl aminopeptidase [Oligoflexia bacterium]
MHTLKSKRELEQIKKACRVVAEVLATLSSELTEGMSTTDLDNRAYELTLKFGAQPAFKGYHGYPATLCVSVNEEVVHGIPDGRIIRNGDIVGIDFGVSIDGWFGDSAVTIPVGSISKEAKQLVETTKECLDRAIDCCVPGNRLGDIGYAVQSLAESRGYGVVREFVGHGIGRALHEEPQIPNYGKKGSGIILEPGMVLAIEPMITAGSHRVKVLKNNWTAVTVDGSLAAHFEHTVAITDQGPVILTDRSAL